METEKQIKPHKEVFNESAFNSALLFRDTIQICVSELETKWKMIAFLPLFRGLSASH